MTSEVQEEIAALKRSLDDARVENESLRELLAPFSPTNFGKVTMSKEANRGITSMSLSAHTDGLTLAPHSKKIKKKIVYLVRHAEAVHNIAEAKMKAEAKAAGKDAQEIAKASKVPLSDPQFLDASLSNDGQDQVKSSGKSFAKLIECTNYPMPKTVLVSPLRRTLMTASILFNGHQDIRATELIRERRTGFPCDERQAAHVTEPYFPGIIFDEIAQLDARHDDGYNFREELKEQYCDAAERGNQVLPFIEGLSADVVAIVSHKGFLRELMQDSWKDIYSCPENLKSELDNAEVRVCEITWKASGREPIVSIVGRSLQTAIAEPTVEIHSNIDFAPKLRETFSATDPCLRAGVATSDKDDIGEAIEEVWQNLQRRIGGLPTVALAFGHCSLDAGIVAQKLRAKQPCLNVIGCSSMRGIITSSGRARLGIMGLDGWATHCGVGNVAGSSIFDSSSAQSAGIAAVKQATRGLRPDMIIMCASPGYEEHILKGINMIYKGVRIFGCSAGNDSLVQGSHDVPWQLYGSMAGWGAITDGGLVLLAIWQNRDCKAHCVISHCYGATTHMGQVTRAEGRNIWEIGGRPASDIILEWTGASSWESVDCSQYALAFGDCLVDFKGKGDFGELQCFSSTASDLGSCSVQLKHLKPAVVTEAIKAVLRKAKKHTQFETRALFVVICAGTSCLFSADDFQKIETMLREIAPEAIAIFSLGEQGNAQSGKEAFHGNNMLNFLFFG